MHCTLLLIGSVFCFWKHPSIASLLHSTSLGCIQLPETGSDSEPACPGPGFQGIPVLLVPRFYLSYHLGIPSCESTRYEHLVVTWLTRSLDLLCASYLSIKPGEGDSQSAGVWGRDALLPFLPSHFLEVCIHMISNFYGAAPATGVESPLAWSGFVYLSLDARATCPWRSSYHVPQGKRWVPRADLHTNQEP